MCYSCRNTIIILYVYVFAIMPKNVVETVWRWVTWTHLVPIVVVAALQDDAVAAVRRLLTEGGRFGTTAVQGGKVVAQLAAGVRHVGGRQLAVAAVDQVVGIGDQLLLLLLQVEGRHQRDGVVAPVVGAWFAVVLAGRSQGADEVGGGLRLG